MELTNIVKEYLSSIKYSIKLRTYIYYSQLNDTYISTFKRELNVDNLKQFIVDFKEHYSYSTTKSVKSLIDRSLKFAYENNLIDKLYKVNILLKQNKVRNIQALSNKEQQKIESYILDNNKFYHYGILISLYTGLRIGELLSLKWVDIDFKNKLITIKTTLGEVSQNHKTIQFEDTPKTLSSQRILPISKNVYVLLKQLKQNGTCEYIISSHKNKRIRIRAYQKSFENLLNKLKIKHYGFHSLRHTFATRLLENRIDIKTISELMGHSSPTITLNRYVHTNLENKRKALENLTKKSVKITD